MQVLESITNEGLESFASSYKDLRELNIDPVDHTGNGHLTEQGLLSINRASVQCFIQFRIPIDR